jgi:hypothetical protein
MRFEDTGLPDDKMVRDAYKQARAQALSSALRQEALLGYEELVDQYYQEDMAGLLADYLDGHITKAEFNLEKRAIQEIREENRDIIIPKDLPAVLEQKFRDASLAPALEIHRHSENATPELISAALLAASVRSPVDCAAVAGKFGPVVAGIIAEKLHIDSYVTRRGKNLAAASADTKRLFMAGLSNQFRLNAAAARKKGDGQKLFLPEHEAMEAFAEAQLLWGADKKLGKRLVSTFNSAARALESPFILEGGPRSDLTLVKTLPKKPSRRRKTHRFGDDGF